MTSPVSELVVNWLCSESLPLMKGMPYALAASIARPSQARNERAPWSARPSTLGQQKIIEDRESATGQRRRPTTLRIASSIEAMAMRYGFGDLRRHAAADRDAAIAAELGGG